MLSQAFQGGAAWSTLVELLGQHRLVAIAAGLALLMIILLYLLTGLTMAGRPGYVGYPVAGGTASISLKAVESFVRGMAQEDPRLVRVIPCVRLEEGRLTIRADLDIRLGSVIPDLCDRYRTRLSAGVREQLSLEPFGEIELRVRNVVK